MKKRYLAILLCICMIATLLPAAAFDDAPSGVFVGGTDVSEGTYYVMDGFGGLNADGAGATNYNVYYRSQSHCLILRDAIITKNFVWGDGDSCSAAIYADGPLTIIVVGHNELYGADAAAGATGSESYGIYIAGTSALCIDGSDSLTTTVGKADDRYGSGSLTTTGGEADCSYGIFHENGEYGSVCIMDGAIVAKGQTAACNTLKIDDNYPRVHTALASTQIDGASPEPYAEDALSTYKYFNIFTEVWVGETLLKDGSYYINDGMGGITEDGADETEYNLSYKGGVLTLRGAEIDEPHAFDNMENIANIAIVYSGGSLVINLIGENFINGKETEGDASYGVYAEDMLIIDGSGSLVVNGGTAESGVSRGMYGDTLLIIGGDIQSTGKTAKTSSGIGAAGFEMAGGHVTAVGGTATGSPCESNGVSGGVVLKISGGYLNATGGTTTGSYGPSFGLSGSRIDISGGEIHATGGAVTGSSNASNGMNGGMITISGGEIYATGGDAETSYGIHGYESTSCRDCLVEARGHSYAFGMLNFIDPSRYSVQASTDFNGDDPAEYMQENLSTYKYVRISSAVFVGGVMLAPETYYRNDGAGGITEQYADADCYNVAYTHGQLILKDANITKYETSYDDHSRISAISSDISLQIVLIGENTVSSLYDGDGTNFEDNFAIYSEGPELYITGTGSLKAIGGTANCSAGIGGKSIDISSGDITAIGGNVALESYGMLCFNCKVQGAAMLQAISGDAPYGIGCGVYIRYEQSGGSVTATGGTAEEMSLGLFSQTVDLLYGSLKASGGEATISYGVSNIISDEEGEETETSFNICGGKLEASGLTAAVTDISIYGDFGSPYTFTASTLPDGSVPVEYNEADLSTYKYLRIDSAPVYISGLPMYATDGESSYYINGTDGFLGISTTVEVENWNAKLELVDGNYLLTLNGLRLNTLQTGIDCYEDLTIDVSAEKDNLVCVFGEPSPAVNVIGNLLVTTKEGNVDTRFHSEMASGIHVTGDLTVQGFLVGSTSADHDAGVSVGGDLLIEEDGILGGEAFENCTDSLGILVHGDLLMNGRRIAADAKKGRAMEVAGTFTMNRGILTAAGEAGVLNKQPQLEGYPDYIWSTFSDTFFKTPYHLSPDHQELTIMPAPRATIEDCTVGGTPETAITPVDVVITLPELYDTGIAVADNVSSWFTNMPQGLIATVSAIADDGVTFTVHITGTPTEDSAEVMTVTIPQILSNYIFEITVDENENAMWKILYSTYTLSFETNGGSTVPAQTEDSGTVIDLAGYTPTKDGFAFDGWYADAALTTEISSVKLNSHVTVYAKWTKRTVFTDVPNGAYYKGAVDWAVANGITAGTTPTTFSPDGICSRSQSVAFLWRASGSPEPETTVMPFRDVPAGSYYYTAVLWAVESGITAGTSANTFSPDMQCSRAQIVTMLWRMEGSVHTSAANPFSDVAAGAYYTPAVLWAVDTGVTAGTSQTTFSPDAVCTRAQIVTFIYRDMQ